MTAHQEWLAKLRAMSIEELQDEYINLRDINDINRQFVEYYINAKLLEKLSQLTAELTAASEKTGTEVVVLTDSSKKLEHLTVRLKNLTWVLIALTALAVIIPIGIEVWKAYHEPSYRASIRASKAGGITSVDKSPVWRAFYKSIYCC